MKARSGLGHQGCRPPNRWIDLWAWVIKTAGIKAE
jgi:hypothetical protein